MCTVGCVFDPVDYDTVVVSLKLTYTANTCQQSLSAFSAGTLRASLVSRLAQSGQTVSPSDISIVLRCSTSVPARLLAHGTGDAASRHTQTTQVSLLQVCGADG